MTMSDTPTAPLPAELRDPPPRRRRRWLRWVVLAAVLVLLVAGVVVADRAGASYARQRLTEEAATRAKATGGSVRQVEVAGVPFLTQFVGGRYDGVSIDVQNVGAAGLTAARLKIVATGIQLSPGDVLAGTVKSAVADRVDATAVIPVSSIASGLAPRGITMTPTGNAVRISAPASLAGYSGSISGLATLVVTAGQLKIRLSNLTAAGYPLPPQVSASLSRHLSQYVRAPALPYGLKLASIKVTGPNITATATGAAVHLG